MMARRFAREAVDRAPSQFVANPMTIGKPVMFGADLVKGLGLACAPPRGRA
jgi:hypothetical protein